MHTKLKFFLLALLVTLSIASFCYLNFYSPTVAQATAVPMIEVLPDATKFQSVIPEFDLLEQLLKRIRPNLYN